MRLSRLRLVSPALIVMIVLVVVPVHAQPAGLVATDHALMYAVSPNGNAGVREVIDIVNRGDDIFRGELTFSLAATATSVQAILERGVTAVPVPSGEMKNGTEGGFAVHRLSLSDHNLTLPPGALLRVHLFYAVSAEDVDRRFDLPAERFLATLSVPDGSAPRAADYSIVHWPTRGLFTTLPDEGRDRSAGDTFAFTVDTLDAPLEPIRVAIRTSGQGTLTLTPDVGGGLPPYLYAWDTDGDGTFETATDSVQARDGLHTYTLRVMDRQDPPVAVTTTYTVNDRAAGDGVTVPTTRATTNWVIIVLAAFFGALIMFGLSAGGLVPGGRSATRPSTPTGGRSIAAESRDMLELRKRTHVAALKELELAKKKGEVPDGLYLPLKEELKGETVRVMRELERRDKETV